MWDVKHIVNLCVKCESKFTSPEKPLKLLPCLHSMCLDCLYGRRPVRQRIQKKESVPIPTDKDSTNKDKVDNSGDQQLSSPSKPNQDEDGTESASASTSVTPKDGESRTTDTAGSSVASTENESEKTVTESEDSGVTQSNSSNNDDSNNNVNNSGSGDAQDNVKPISDDTDASKGVNEEKDSSASSELESSHSHDAVESTNLSVNNDHETSSTSKVGDAADSEVETDAFDPEEKPKPVTECPVCRDPIDQSPISLMDNMFAALDPDQPSSPIADSKQMCTACDENQQAESYCQQCEEWLCENCIDAHRRVRITKDHIISPKDQVKVVTSKSPWEQLMTCKQHKQEQLKFFCEKCEKLTCRDCQLLDHKDHKYQFLDQAAEQYKARLKGSLALMGEKRNKLQANQDEIQLKLNNCKDQKDQLQQDILKQAEIMIKGIRQAAWSVLSNLASFTDAATKRLNKEIEDVKELVNKFDHCVQFMEDILQDGSSMSLLYSKGNVESKCRKVYHTQVDPQSLKGNLQIQYRHEVNWLLGNLNKIGAIYVNGVRYPPEKNINGQPNRPNQKGSVYQEQKAGLSATSPHLHHMANQAIPGQPMQSDWTKFIQTVSKPSAIQPHGGPPNMNMGIGPGATLPPQLSLPNRRGAQAAGLPQSWPGMGPGIQPGQFVAGQLLTPQQQQQQAPRPAFQPMRLHHRPATLAQFNPNDQSSNNMRSPPQYRGGEASGTSRPSSHGTPDPARPASAGMYDGNPSSSSMIDIKKEHRDTSPDCIITSSHMKADRPSVFQTTPPNSRLSETVLEMQRNLDDVIRAVPMNISDNLEQIGVVKSSNIEATRQKSVTPEVERVASPTAEELRENWQGGNSMPGFSLSQADQQVDPNDDYCACCHNGGDVLCCDTCPKVFHLQCHIPELPAVPTGSFICTICDGDKPVEHEEMTSGGKRKAPGGLTDTDIRVCERIMLELFCHPSSVPFQEPVNKTQVPNYYKIITQPMDFVQVKGKLQRHHPSHYQSIKAFLYDLRQCFINCAIYNKAGSEVGKAGKIVRALFEELVERLIPQYLNFCKENPSPMFSALYQIIEPRNENSGENGNGPSSPKRPKVD